MKKVVVYGVRKLEIRRYIDHFLDESYEIIGYTDGHYTRDILDGKTFIPLEELSKWSFDFVLVCASSSSAQAEIKRSLKVLGVPPEKIVRPLMLLGKGYEKELTDLIADIEKNYHPGQNLIFGLSYSAEGVIEKKLNRPFYNCSSSGMDIYGNLRICEYMAKNGSGGPISAIETALFVIPYYYFDYDMSRTLDAYVYGRPFAMWRLDDWHHYLDVPGAWEYVENYRMFGEKTVQYYHVPKRSQEFWNVYGAPDGTGILGPLWFAEHESTVEENKELFVRFSQRAKSVGAALNVIVPPLYLRGLNSLSRDAFLRKKAKFYDILKTLEAETGAIPIYDYSDRFGNCRERFYNLDHLNMTGAKLFTEFINQDILDHK